MAGISPDELGALRQKRRDRQGGYIRVGMSTCGIAAGAARVYGVLEEEIKKRGLDIDLQKCGCLGMCHAEPLVEVALPGMPAVVYAKVDEDCAREICRRHVEKRKLLQDFIIDMQSEDAS